MPELSARKLSVLAAVTVAASLGASIAATPSLGARFQPALAPLPIVKATLGDSATALRPFGDGPAILIGRVYGGDDEDCALAVTRVEGSDGQVSVTRGIACSQ
ncbi:hypothetical protein [Methylosinus sp. KRF6]|uniref:hypothetical protein n=1 Tax=Methylosinus sp. KRF6 TaxID=2846853 RepID=UPI001C0E0B5A|nr:hypothetical protein [Methylosinus sp. KRF6]MBU3889627.1 hypothetical protein [Methylosinus sp. KRF6]